MKFRKALRFLLVVAVLFMAMSDMALLAADDVNTESNCPKKAPVVVEELKPSVFMEYQYFSAQGRAEIVAVKSPVSGLVSEIKVSEGSLVDLDQELAVMNAGADEELDKLEAAAAKAKKILVARQNWKEKSEAAIRSAEKAYQNALELMNEKKSQVNRVVKAPVAGIVHLVMAAGTAIEADALLLEISNPRQMIFQAPLKDADRASLKISDKFIGTGEGFKGEVEAEIVAISDALVSIRVNNDSNQVKDGVTFTFKKFIAEHVDAIVIPSAAIQKDSLGDFVYVVEKKKAKKLYVTPGAAANDKTMIAKGLATDTMLIVSGLECVVDGKKIRIVNREELAKDKAKVQAKEKDKPAIKKEKKVAEPEVKTKIVEEAEKIGEANKHRYIVGLTFERFTINDKNMREYYSYWFQHIPGLEFSYQAVDKIDIWATAKFYTVKQTTLFFEDTVRFTLIPFSIGGRFRPAKLGSLEPFVGAGINFYYYRESIKGVAELDPTSGLAFGFHFQGGTYFYFSPSFLKSIFAKHNRSLLGEIFVKFNIVNKTLAEALPEDEGNKLDLGGFEMGIGLAVKF
ncbi:MAG: HlyD family efflux transporter periplasmic adaptor subunit [Candidatus Aminicenantes bacterium]|nr:HlyD family efflux transporter periplasmic adaptor subunit [Candidatus Aminicenantes bacterium]